MTELIEDHQVMVRPGIWHASSRLTHILVLCVIALFALGALALGVAIDNPTPTAVRPVACGSTAPKLTVHGTGQAVVTPDLLTVSVEVDSSGPSASTALAADNTTTSTAVAAFKSGGVGPPDVQTSGLSLQPQYVYPKGLPVLTGYQVTNDITATIHHVATAGSVIDDVVGSAGNDLHIDSINFSVADPGAVEDRARSMAVAQAVTHARSMAAAAGRTLGAVCSLSDQTQIPVPNQGDLSYASAAVDGTAASVPIEAGSQTESAQISLTYLLEPDRH
jgi:uncharacterized protein